MTSQPTEPKPLNQRLNKRLLAYAAVAGAGVAGSASAADAKVVYTPVHYDLYSGDYIDLNHDGVPDFSFFSSYLSGIGRFGVSPMRNANKIVGIRRACSFSSLAAAPLPKGTKVGPNAKLTPSANCMIGLADWSSNGPWLGVPDHYLGFEFEIAGKQHFGWARITGEGWFCCHALARITGYAYETVPGRPIVAGDTGPTTDAGEGTLGALALGAPGLDWWRRQDQL